MAQDRRVGMKLFLWIVLAMVLHYTALVTGQMLVSTVFAVKDVADGMLTYDSTGEIYYNGEVALESEEYMNRYGYVTAGYGNLVALPIVVIGLFVFNKIRRRKTRQILAVNRFPVIPAILALIIGLAIYFPISFIVSNSFLNDLSPDTGNAIQSMFEQTPYWILFISTAIGAPLMEELTFRGFIYSQLEETTQLWHASLEETYEEMKTELLEEAHGELKQKAIEERLKKIKRRTPIFLIITQAFMFGAFHMNLQQFVYATALGMLFGIMRHYTKSVWPSVLAHIGFNAFSIGIYGLSQHPEWSITQMLNNMPEITFLLITLLVFAVALLLFEIVVKKGGKNGEKTSQNP